MKGTLLIMLLCLLPLCAMAQEAQDDGENAVEAEDGITTEVEGKGNKVIVIEELVVNINAGDIVSNRAAGGEEAMGLVHRLLDMLHGGPGPRNMEPVPQPGMPDMPQMGPDGMRGMEMRGMKMDPMNHPPQPAGDDRRQAGRHLGPIPGPDGRGQRGPGMRMPGKPDAMMRGRGPEPNINMGQDVKQLIMRAGKLAWSNPKFRDALANLVREFEKGEGKPHHSKQQKPRKARHAKPHRAKQHKPARAH